LANAMIRFVFAMIHPLQAVSRQRSAVSRQRSAVSRQPSAFKCYRRFHIQNLTSTMIRLAKDGLARVVQVPIYVKNPIDSPRVFT